MSTDRDKARRAASQDRDPDAYVVRLRDLRVALAEVDRLTADRDALRARVAELERAADAARKAERDRCADIVNGWHISKGGYTELAYVLRTAPK